MYYTYSYPSSRVLEPGASQTVFRRTGSPTKGNLWKQFHPKQLLVSNKIWANILGLTQRPSELTINYFEGPWSGLNQAPVGNDVEDKPQWAHYYIRMDLLLRFKLNNKRSSVWLNYSLKSLCVTDFRVLHELMVGHPSNEASGTAPIPISDLAT